MKRIYWLIMSIVWPPYIGEYKRLGEAEYLARHGAIEWKEVEGEAVIKLDKHLNK